MPAALLALLVAATASPVAARPNAGVGEAPAADRLQAGDRPIDDLASVHWLHEQEHASDVIAFEPGERVTVPFRPRADDTWTIDGKAPKPLPAGNANGREMRDAPQGSVWAKGAPGRSEAAGPHAPAEGSTAPAADPLQGIDQPTGDPDAVADPAAFSGSTAGAGDGTVATAPVGPTGLRREVFGFLPYWEVSDSSTVLDWRVLSTVAYFSVGCRGNGDLAKKNGDGSLTTGWAGWTSSRMTSIINAAHERQSRVVLTVSCFAWSSANAETQAKLLGSATARANLAKQAAAAVRDRGADGINLDFEPIVTGYADEFVDLVRRTRTELNAIAPGYQLTFDTLGSLGSQPIVSGTAPGAADAVFIMGYDYRTSGANYAGSISPLAGPSYDLGDTVKAYLAKISPSKVILGIPWYGRAWSTATDDPHARVLDPAKYGSSAAPLYAQAVDLASANGRRWDSVEQAPWTAYQRQTCTTTYGCVTSWRELYYDDAASLKLKYDLVNRQQLRGVGIWALGYDDTRTELRTALADKFLLDKTPPVVGVGTLASSQRDEAFKVSWKSWDDSSIRGYDVEVSANGDAWARWLTGTTSGSRTYYGQDGVTYAFRVRATDVHGNVASWSVGSVEAFAAPGEVAAGGFATVLLDGLRMRASASTDASIMMTLAAGDALQVIGGPVSADGYTWFQVAGPIKQWNPVDQLQVGGWVAAYGTTSVNVAPRRPVYATTVDAGITNLELADGGQRVLVPDGSPNRLRVSWTNNVAFDSLALRVHRTDGSVVGAVTLGETSVGDQVFDWDGRIGGALVPDGTYVLQLQGLRGALTYSSPAANPTVDGLASRFGVIVGPAAPTSVLSFTSTPASPTTSGTLTYGLTFGGPVDGLGVADLVRTGTAAGCTVGAPTGSGASWSVKVTGCGQGTVVLTLRARSVADAVENLGPVANVAAPSVLIDRTGPAPALPKLALEGGVALATNSGSVGMAATVSWSATDPGGAGVRDYDVRRSIDGGPWKDVLVGTTATSTRQWLNPGHTYRYEVRARDNAGNVGPWVAGASMPVLLRQNENPAITYRGSWKLSIGSWYSGSSARYATAAGASARYSFTGRSVALVMTRGPQRGAVKVYLDGALVATVDTYAAAFEPRSVVWTRAWSASGTHTLRIVVVGTPGRPRVDLDAIALLK